MPDTNIDILNYAGRKKKKKGESYNFNCIDDREKTGISISVFSIQFIAGYILKKFTNT